MTAGAWVLIAAVVAALAFGLHRAGVDGRFAGTRRVPSSPAPSPEVQDVPSLVDVAAGSGVDLELGERATLLQFSSAFCAPCRATRRTLAEVAAVVPGVRHVEVDAEHHLELVRAVGVLRTPTTLVLDARGAEVTRAAGAPRKEQVLDALTRA
jgi:thiol-disulfide isomerase/thioredoxin